MRSLRWLASYLLVASLGLWLAFAVSTKFLAPARSQEAPANGDLPADFLKEVEATQVPGEGTSAPTPTATPAVPSSVEQTPPPSEPSAVPPPPPESAAELPLDNAIPESEPAPMNTAPRDGYVYDPTGKRDPFRAFRSVRPVLEKAVSETLEPLQRYEVEKLQVVGILWDVGTPRAMIKDPEGGVHTIVKSSKIGRAEGFVAAIREGEIVIVETRYEDGKSFKETRVLELKK